MFLLCDGNENFGHCLGFIHILYDNCFLVGFSLCLYLFTCPDLETAYKQAKMTAFTQNISLGRQGLEQRKVLKREFS